MTTLSWPAGIVPASAVWHLEANTAVYTSPLTRVTQAAELAGARWVADFTFPPFTAASWRIWSVFAARMRGQANVVAVTPPQYRGSAAPLYPAGLELTVDSTAKKADSSTPRADERFPVTLGAPVIDGAGQAGSSLATRGWSAAAWCVMAGDFVSYDTARGRTLHLVLEDVQSDAWGDAVIQVEPPLRNAPADGAAVEHATPSCLMRLADNRAGALTFVPGITGRTDVGLVEAF